MSKTKKKKTDMLDQDCHVSNVASATDYTGLAQAPPLNEDEAASLNDLYTTPQVEDLAALTNGKSNDKK
jgi:hypothetical protein